MLYLRSRRSARRLAGVLASLLAAPYLSAAGTAAAAEPAPEGVCVVDFNNASRTGAADLGRVAASRFTEKLVATGAVAVAGDDAVRKQASELKLQAPFDRAARARLAGGLRSSQVIYGTITTVRFTEKPQVQAYVRLMVMREDAASGAVVQGLISEGASAPRLTLTGPRDELIAEAIANAAASFAAYTASACAPSCGPEPAVPGDSPAALRPGGAGVPIVSERELKAQLAQAATSGPVVIDIPGGDPDGRVRAARRPIITTKTARLLVGGALLMVLFGLGGAGGFGATRPF